MGAKIVSTAQRGEIFDVQGRPLATSVAAYSLSINPTKCPNVPAFHLSLATAAGLDPITVAVEFAGSRNHYAVIAKGLAKDRTDAIRTLARAWRADGISLTPEPKRVYPNGHLASHILGFVSADGKAHEGIERSFDDRLRGRDGLVAGPTDANGFLLAGHRTVDRPAKTGNNLRLTIDLEVQEAVTEALQEAVRLRKPSTAVAIVMEPHTGNILAMVSLPEYDPNKPGEALKNRHKNAPVNNSPLRNSFTSLTFAPGSTFKMITVAAALDCGAIDLNTLTTCTGTREFGGVKAGCAAHEGSRAHGVCTPMKTMTVSCNLSAGVYAQKIGADRFIRYIRSFGCVDRTNLGLPGERRGMLELPETWGNQAHQLAVMGFGQSITMTPLQLTTAVCALANDGRVVLPRLIDRIGDVETPVRYGKQAVSPKVAATVMKMLQSVVEDKHGTGHAAAVPGYHVGGKTGTAQRPDPITKKMSHSLYDSYFVGVVPVDKNPRAVVLVMLDEPRVGYYGGAVSAPVFAKIARYLTARWRMAPDNALAQAQKTVAR